MTILGNPIPTSLWYVNLAGKRMRWKALQWLPRGDEEVFAPASDIVTYSGHISHCVSFVCRFFVAVINIIESPLQSTGPNHSVDVMLKFFLLSVAGAKGPAMTPWIVLLATGVKPASDAYRVYPATWRISAETPTARCVGRWMPEPNRSEADGACGWENSWSRGWSHRWNSKNSWQVGNVKTSSLSPGISTAALKDLPCLGTQICRKNTRNENNGCHLPCLSLLANLQSVVLAFLSICSSNRQRKRKKWIAFRNYIEHVLCVCTQGMVVSNAMVSDSSDFHGAQIGSDQTRGISGHEEHPALRRRHSTVRGAPRCNLMRAFVESFVKKGIIIIIIIIIVLKYYYCHCHCHYHYHYHHYHCTTVVLRLGMTKVALRVVGSQSLQNR